MNKKLMAIAVAGALSAPGLAAAQVGGTPGVTFYGVLEEAIFNIKYGADFKSQTNQAGATGELKKGELFSVASRVGFRGREDLGGGSSVWFQIEEGVTLNGRNETTNLNSNVFGGRPSALGITNSWGDVFFGIWDAPYKRVTDQTYNLINSGPLSSSGVLMGNGDTTGSMPNAICASSNPNAATGVLPTTGICFPEVTSSTTSFHRRSNDSINYTTPLMEGFQVSAQTQLPNYQSPGGSTNGSTPLASGTQHPKMWSFSGTWARGPLLVALGYELHQGFRPGTLAGQNVDPKDIATQAGLKWDFGMAQIGLGYEVIKYGDNGVPNGAAAASSKMDVKNYQVNGKMALGPGTLWAQYSAASTSNCTNPTNANTFLVVGNAACGSAGDAKEMSLGYDYILSKRTKMYVAYNKIDNGNGTNYYYAAASAPAQTGNGTLNGVTAGTDVTNLVVGVQHSF